VHGIYPITKPALAQRTQEYQRWVEAFARNQHIPIQWPDKDMKKKGLKQEDYVRPYGLAMERQKRFGVYFIFKVMEQGPTFRSCLPRYPTEDPHYRIIRRKWSPYTHYYFYIRDEVLGPVIVCVGSFLPFQTRYWINGHSFIASELQRQGIQFRKDDNAFLWVSDPAALQAAADRLSPEIIRERLDYWTFVLGPKFSKKDRAAIPLRRSYSLNQVEYALNVVFRRHFPIHKIFERSAELGLFCLTADKVAQIFGVRKHKRMRGKLHSMLEKIDQGIMSCASIAKAWWRACMKSSLPSCAWKSASTGSRISASTKGWTIGAPYVRSSLRPPIVSPSSKGNYSMSTSTFPSFNVWLFPSVLKRGRAKSRALRSTTRA